MIYTLIVFVILLTFTLEPKYLGKLKVLSLRNITSKTNVQTIRHGLLIAFLLWVVYYLFHKEITTFFRKEKEPMSDDMLSDMEDDFETDEQDDKNKKNKSNKNKNKKNKKNKNKKNKSDKNKSDKNKSDKNEKNTMPTITEPTMSTMSDSTKPTMSTMSESAKPTMSTMSDSAKPTMSTMSDSTTTVPTKNTFPRNNKQQVQAPAPGTLGSDTLPVPPEDELLKTPAASGPDYETSHSSMINHPELTKGLTIDKVTPKPVYYEPGTVKYNGLGYVPSYSEMIYLNNYPFESTPKELHEGNPHGFCSTKDNVLNNIEEKCNGLPTNVCSTTDCCVLVGGTHCVEGDEKGPKNKVIYSDTSIKNRDVYYYKSGCYGNCK